LALEIFDLLAQPFFGSFCQVNLALHQTSSSSRFI
jgi:hypothetical protein